MLQEIAKRQTNYVDKACLYLPWPLVHSTSSQKSSFVKLLNAETKYQKSTLIQSVILPVIICVHTHTQKVKSLAATASPVNQH